MARAALLGQAGATPRTQGETLLVAKAGGEKADPLIRYVVDDEFGGRGPQGQELRRLKVMFWRSGPEKRSPAVEAAATPAPVNPAAEEARVKSLTGGQPVVIARAKPGKIKLPGL